MIDESFVAFFKSECNARHFLAFSKFSFLYSQPCFYFFNSYFSFQILFFLLSSFQLSKIITFSLPAFLVNVCNIKKNYSQSLQTKKFQSQKQPPEVFYEKRVLKNFVKSSRKYLSYNLFFNEVAGLSPQIPTKVFSCEFLRNL